MPAIELHWTTLLLAALVVLGASFVKATTGFGFAMTASPFLLLLLEPKLVVVVMVPLWFLIDIFVVLQSRGHIDFRRVMPMVIAAALGIPLGNYILIVIPAAALKFTIAMIVLVFGVYLLLGYTFTIRREGLASALAGFFSGTLLTSAGIAGPPVALFLINQQLGKEAFRPSLCFYFLLVDIIGLSSFAISGVISVRSLSIDLALLPAVFLGYLVAVLVFPRIKPALFRRITILVIIAAAVTAILSVITGYLRS
jgi:hypothetical protein